jgi:hypothetical protein
MPTNDENLGLADVPRELNTLTGQTTNYHNVWQAVVSGGCPAIRNRGRWLVRRADLPVLARLLGISRAAAEPTEPSKPTGAAEATLNA